MGKRGPRARTIEPISLLTETELAYIAGLLDGEGCFTAQISAGKRLYSRICVVMTDREAIRWFSKRVDIAFGLKRSPSFKSHHQDQYRAALQGGRCALLCEAILPYLVTKKKHARILIELQKLVGPLGSNHHDHPISSTLKKRAILKRRLSELNTRGWNGV